MDQRHLAGRRGRAELGDRRRRAARLVEQLAHPAGLVGADDHRAVDRQLREPRAGPVGSAGDRRCGAVAAVGRRLLLEHLAGPRRQDLEGAERVVRSRPLRRQLARGHEAVETVRGLAVEIGGQRAQLVEVGEDGVSRAVHVIGSGPGGEDGRPRLGGLPDLALRQPRGILRQQVGRRGGTLHDRLPAVGRQELGGGHEVDRLQAPARGLGHRVEAADRLDLVPEQLDANRISATRWPCVDEAAAVRELADSRHLDARLVAAGDEALEQGALRDPLPDPDTRPRGAQLLRTEGALDEGEERADDDEVPRTRPRGRPARSAARRTRRAREARAPAASAARSGSVRTWLAPTHATRSSARRCASSSVRATTTIGRDGRKARAPNGKVRRAGGGGHTKDARLRQMGPKGVDERCDAAITAARRGHAAGMVPGRLG